ncbi:hypothetical protein WA158_003224 [Blastocystis sp. Blastoise]
MFALRNCFSRSFSAVKQLEPSLRDLVQDKVFPLENRVVFRLKGKRSRSFLHTVCTNHVIDLRQGDISFSCFLTPTGSIMSEAYLYGDKDDKDSVIMDLHVEQQNLMLDYLTEAKKDLDVTIEDITKEKQIWAFVNENNDKPISLSDDTYIDPRVTMYSPLPLYRCIMEKKDIEVAKQKYALGDIDIWNKFTFLRGLWQGPHIQGYSIYHIHSEGDNCLDLHKGNFVGLEGLEAKDAKKTPKKRVIPAIISTTVPTSPFTFNSLYTLPNIHKYVENEITSNVEEETEWTDGHIEGNIIYRFPKSNICLVLIPMDMPLDTHIYTHEFKYKINMIEPNWNF